MWFAPQVRCLSQLYITHFLGYKNVPDYNTMYQSSAVICENLDSRPRRASIAADSNLLYAHFLRKSGAHRLLWRLTTTAAPHWSKERKVEGSGQTSGLTEGWELWSMMWDIAIEFSFTVFVIPLFGLVTRHMPYDS